jgi:hypothetical protein
MNTQSHPSHSYTPPPPHQLWRLDRYPGIAQSLPKGELTLIRIGNGQSSEAWWGTVGFLIDQALSQGQQVDLVRVDGALTNDLRELVDWNEGSGLLNVIDDSDVLVSPWHQHLRPHGYRCNIPTLHIVHAALEQRAASETSLLVLDHFQRARPWRGEGETTYRDASRIDPLLVAQERAGQIHAFARMRRHAPTVAVWHSEQVLPAETVHALVDDTRLSLEHGSDGAGTGYLRAFVRGDLVAELAG